MSAATEGPWAKIGALSGIVAIVVTYGIAAAQSHWWPFATTAAPVSHSSSGRSSSGGGATVPVPTPTGSELLGNGLSAREGSLARSLPTSVFKNCRSATVEQAGGPGELVAALYCDPADTTDDLPIIVMEYSSDAELAKWYQPTTSGITQDGPCNRGVPFHGSWSDSRGVSRGLVACRPAADNRNFAIIWTYGGSPIAAMVKGSDPAQVYAWWDRVVTAN